MNLATLLEGPANVTHLGQTFHFRGGLTLTPLADLFSITTDLDGVIDQRALDSSFVLTGTPVGVWNAAQLAALYRTAALPIGSLLNPRYDVLSVTAATNVILLVGAVEPRLGAPVRFIGFPGATLPAGLSAATLYYYNTAGTLHTTAADALAGTNPVDITTAGTGDFALIEQEPIVIDAITANRRITLHNGVIVTPPPLILSAIATMFGSMAFGAFIREGKEWTDDNSVYTVEKVALTDTPPDKDDILTQAYSCAFGAAPFDAFKSRGPITITPTLGTEAITTDGLGMIGMKVASRGISATLSPQGFSELQMLDLLKIQGAGSGRGISKTRGDLVITGTGVTATLKNGAPRQLPQTFQATGPRAGELEIVGHATPGEAPFTFTAA